METHIAGLNLKHLTDPPPGKGLITVIRRPRFAAALHKLDVFIDAKKVGKLRNKSYLNFAVAPGRHNVTVASPHARHAGSLGRAMRQNMARGTFDVEAGKRYTLLADFGRGDLLKSAIYGTVLNEVEAQSYLTKATVGIYLGIEQPAAAVKARPSAAVAPAAAANVDAPAYKSKEREDDFAIVVGIGAYKDLPDAKFAERDAEAMRKHLIAMGYPERQVVLLKGSDATRSGLQKYLEEWLPRNVTPSSNVFFYYSGHGAPDTRTGKAYLVPWDGDASFLKSTAYPLEQLYAALNSLKAKQIIVALDTCFSGAGGRSVLAEGARPLVTKVDLGKIPGGKLTLLTAASGNEITTTLKKERHGIFTYFFLKGLGGDAKDAQGRITTESLFNYLRPKVQREARLQNREQTPTYHSQSSVVIRSR